MVTGISLASYSGWRFMVLDIMKMLRISPQKRKIIVVVEPKVLQVGVTPRTTMFVPRLIYSAGYSLQ